MRMDVAKQRGQAERVLSYAEAKAFYDRFGKKQDLQRIYEDPAIEVLLEYSSFQTACAVVELGCGTGRLAARLLDEILLEDAKYVGLDISRTMIELAQGRLESWADRARVQQTDGSPIFPLSDGGFDRCLSTYVLDLLSEEDIHAALSEARRVLAPGGRLCLASLSFGQTLASRLTCRAWTAIHSLSPRLVGGCRPLRLDEFIGSEWQILHREVVCTLGICTEVLVARRQ
jgi:ubiquinone/menaquinone biosynthesis C-methylase UbiE